MIPAAAAIVVVLVARLMLAGAAVDLGPNAAPWSGGLLVIGLGLGLASRTRMPALGDAVALALLVPARGLLCDLVLALLSGATLALPVAAAVSMAPAGFALGRLAGRAVVGAALVGPWIGWMLGEALVALGAAAWLPPWFTGAAAAATLALLVEMRGKTVDDTDVPPGVTGLPVGLAVALLLVTLDRIVPAYVEPPAQPSAQIRAQVLLVLLVLLVPASVVAGRGFTVTGRVLLSLAALALAWWVGPALEGMAIYERGADYFAYSQQLHNEYATPYAPLTNDFRVWLVSFPARLLAPLGIMVGCLRGRVAGPFAIGAGLGVLAEAWIDVDPVHGPAALVVLAGGAALVAVPMAIGGPRGAWLLPLVVVPFLVYPKGTWPAFDGIRRIGEFDVASFSRTVAGDVSVASIPAGEGELDRRMRFGGLELHEGHVPVGPYGSVSRLARLFASDGPLLAAGLAVELPANDLLDAGLATSVSVATSMPLPHRALLELNDALGLSGLSRERRVHTELALARARDGFFGTVLIAPAPDACARDAGSLAAVDSLEHAAAALAPGGRCLLWLDTAHLDARALGARMAAFGTVFGEQSLALVELRELDPPFVLLVGWLDEAGRLDPARLRGRLPSVDPEGRRVRVADLADLDTLVIADGPRLARLARSGPVHRRARAVTPNAYARTAGAALLAVYDPDSALANVLAGGVSEEASDGSDLSPVLAGLAQHGRYSYHLEALRSQILEITPDIDWDAFEAEVALYAQGASADPGNPALHLVVAALLEPLVEEKELTRFDEAYGEVGGWYLESPRLARLEAEVLEEALQPEKAAAARRRAEEWEQRWSPSPPREDP